jgi:hypothetical protein
LLLLAFLLPLLAFSDCCCSPKNQLNLKTLSVSLCVCLSLQAESCQLEISCCFLISSGCCNPKVVNPSPSSAICTNEFQTHIHNSKHLQILGS